MQGQGLVPHVRENHLFDDDPRLCKAWMMHSEATNDDIQKYPEIISIHICIRFYVT